MDTYPIANHGAAHPQMQQLSFKVAINRGFVRAFVVGRRLVVAGFIDAVGIAEFTATPTV